MVKQLFLNVQAMGEGAYGNQALYLAIEKLSNKEKILSCNRKAVTAQSEKADVLVNKQTVYQLIENSNQNACVGLNLT